MLSPTTSVTQRTVRDERISDTDPTIHPSPWPILPLNRQVVGRREENDITSTANAE